MATVTVNPDHSALVTADDDYGPDVHPDNALFDILPQDMKDGMHAPRAPRPSAANASAQPANGTDPNQPVAAGTPLAGQPANGGTKPTEGQPAPVASVIEIAGEQFAAAAPASEPSKTVENTEGTPVASPEDDVIVITPGKKLRTPTGALISSDEVINQEALRPRYDQSLARGNKLEKELAEAKIKIDELAPWVDVATKDKLLANTLTAVRNGAKPVDAIRGAAIQAGMEQEFAQAFNSAPSGPPKPGTPEYYREEDLAKLGLEEGSSEHAEWWKGHVAQNALDRVDKREREIEADRQKRDAETQRMADTQRTTTEEATRQKEHIRTENSKELDKLPELIKQELGIDVNALSESDVDRVATAITQSAAKLRNPLKLGDENWLGQNVVLEDSLRLAIQKSGIRMVQPQVNGNGQPPAATNGQPTKPVQQAPIPSVQSKVLLDPSRPLQPGPQSEGALPLGNSRPYSDDKAYLGALADIISK